MQNQPRDCPELPKCELVDPSAVECGSLYIVRHKTSKFAYLTNIVRVANTALPSEPWNNDSHGGYYIFWQTLTVEALKTRPITKMTYGGFLCATYDFYLIPEDERALMAMAGYKIKCQTPEY